MLSTSMKLLAAVSAALLMPAHTEAAGVCYSPFHAEKYFSDPSAIESVLLDDMAQIAKSTSFAAVRTYHAQFYGQNVIDAVVANGLQVAIGIQMVGVNGSAYEYLDDDIAAAISAAKNHPESVLAIYAGNENLINGDFGSTSADDIISVINQVKSALKGTKGANVPVGTVQRLEEWLNAADVSRVAAASDVVGVNIYPFFTKGGESDMIGSLDAQWTTMTTKYGASKARLTETGWPSQGSVSDTGNTPSLVNAQKYYAAFTQWAANRGTSTSPFYFMMYDLLKAHATSDYEQHFGVSTAGGALKFDLGSSSSSQSRASTTPATAGSVGSTSSSPSAASASSAPVGSTGSAATTSTASSSRTEDAGNPSDLEVAGEADRSADSVPATPTPTPAPAPSSTVLVSSAIGNAISSALSSGSISTTTTNSSTSSVSIPATTTSAPSSAVVGSNSTTSATSTTSTSTSSNSTVNSGSSVTKSPTETNALPSVDEAGGVPNGSDHSDAEDVGFGSSASSFSGSIGRSSSGSSSSSAGASNGPDVGDVDNNNAPVSAPDLTPQTTAAPVATPSPSTASSTSASKDLETQEAQAKRAREVSGNQGWSVQALTVAIGCAGIAAIAVIAVYVQKRRNEESENQVSITTADARDSTPSVYSDPLGTRFSSIVMITPNGDGVCIL
ncbi:hypothetical protein Gpo141_00008535 [Globisporangium polare]